jgi:hypothetical protein
MSEAYREWAQLENPREWTRQVALSTWAVQRRTGGASGSEPARAPEAAPSGGVNGSARRAPAPARSGGKGAPGR